MQKRRLRQQHAAEPLLGLADMPDSWCQLLLCYLSSASRLALRATCTHLMHICDMIVDASSVSSYDSCMQQQQQQPMLNAAGPQHRQLQEITSMQPRQMHLVLKLARRQPSLQQLHGLGLLQHIVVLDTAAAKRGVLSVGVTEAAALAGAATQPQ